MEVTEISIFLVPSFPPERQPAILGYAGAQLSPLWRYMHHSFICSFIHQLIQQIFIEYSPLVLRAQTPETNLNLTFSLTTS